MALPISSIVDVSISVSPSAPAKAGFGVAGILTSEDVISGGIQDTPVLYFDNMEAVAEVWDSSTSTYAMAQAYFGQQPRPARLATLAHDQANQTVEEALDAAETFSSGWYGILTLPTARDTQDQLDVMAWAEARTKLYSAATEDGGTLIVGDTDNNAYRAMQAGYNRTMMTFCSAADRFPDASALGKAFTTNFGAADSVMTLKFKTLPGVPYEEIDSTQKEALDEKRCNVYTQVGDFAMFMEGWMSGPIFFDERHAIDWLTEEIQSNVFSLLVGSVTKIPLTNAGGSMIQQQVVRALDAAVNNGMIAPGETSDGRFLGNGYEVSIQRVEDIPTADKANRVGPVVSFIALLAGAVHSVQINGVVER